MIDRAFSVNAASASKTAINKFFIMMTGFLSISFSGLRGKSERPTDRACFVLSYLGTTVTWKLISDFPSSTFTIRTS